MHNPTSRRIVFTFGILLAGARLAAAGTLTPIFDDGFEAGTTTVWTATAGPLAPATVCTPPLVAIDTSGSTTVVGNGTPASCTESALNSAIATHVGMIRFNCGDAAHTIVVTSQKILERNLVLDGGGTVALSGGGTTRILLVRAPLGSVTAPTIRLQNLAFVNGSTASLPGTTTANGGSAIFRDGSVHGPVHLEILACNFAHNIGPTVGQDVAGGAIYSFGGGATTIVASGFSANRSSNGGALGGLGVTAAFTLTIANTVMSDNAATGNGGNPGNGGNGGAIALDGANQSVSLCGVTLADNTANAHGGGLFRVSNNGVGPMTIDRSAILRNFIPASATSQAGGLYLQGLQATITSSTVAGNTASSAGGLFVWNNPGAQTLNMTNVTVADNHARTSLGAGLAVQSSVTGTLHHVTIARNSNEGEFSFASALSGGNGLAITNSLIADNMKVFTWEDVSCNLTHGGTGNVQWPSVNAGGEAETPCATVDFSNPQLGPLQDNGGATPTIMPAAAGLDLEGTATCAAVDQRGVARPQPCTPGAVEMP